MSPSTQSTAFETVSRENGATFVHEYRETPPIVAIRIFLPGGSASESASQHGIAELTADLLTTQTKERDMYEFGRFVEDHGLKISGSAGHDYTLFSFTCTSDYREELLQLLNEIFMSPGFSEQAFERLKEQQLSKIKQRNDKAFDTAMNEAMKALYGDHPYNHDNDGSLDTVESLGIDDIRSYYENNYTTQKGIVSAVGDIQREELISGFDNLVLPAEEPSLAPPVTESGAQRNYVEMDVDQPTHMLAYPAGKIADPSYPSTKVLNGLLGGGMSSILFNEIREKRSMGYQVGCSFPSRREDSAFLIYLGGGKEDGTEFRNILDEIIHEIAESGPEKKALRRAREYIKGNFLLNHETHGKSAWYRGFYEILGRGADFDDEYPELVDRVDSEQVQSACSEILVNQAPSFVTVRPK
ncbi:MAG: M16 family metallopeptidase [bacterium]